MREWAVALAVVAVSGCTSGDRALPVTESAIYAAALEKVDAPEDRVISIDTRLLDSEGHLPADVLRHLEELGYEIDGGEASPLSTVQLSRVFARGDSVFELEMRSHHATPGSTFAGYRDQVRFLIGCSGGQCSILEELERTHSDELPLIPEDAA